MLRDGGRNSPGHECRFRYTLHMAQNELWQRLAGRPVREIAAALRDMPVFVPGTEEPVRAGDASGEDNPWIAFQATNLHQLDPGMLAAARTARDAKRRLRPGGSPPRAPLSGAHPPSGSRRWGAMSDSEVELGLRLLPRATHVRLDGIGQELHGLHAQRVPDAIGPFLATV